MTRFDWKIERIRKNIKLKELANELMCSEAHICKYENNKGNMSEEKIKLYQDFIKNYNKVYK